MSDDVPVYGAVEVYAVRQYYEGKVLTKEEAVKLEPLKVLQRNVADKLSEGSVSYEAGFTQGLPNYSSYRITVGVTLPCVPEEVNSALEVCKNVVDAELISQRTALNDL